MQHRFEWLEYASEVTVRPMAPTERPYLLEATRHYAEGEFELALRAWSQALQTDKARHDAWAGQVHCLVRLEEIREAQVWAAKACQLFPGIPMLHAARARALAAGGLLAQSMGASDQALELAERTGLQVASLWLDRAACLLADSQMVTAGFCLDKVRELRPDDVDWEQEIGLEFLASQCWSEALVPLSRVVELRPQRAFAWCMLARAWRCLGQPQRVARALEAVERINPNYPGLQVERRATWPLALGYWLKRIGKALISNGKT